MEKFDIGDMVAWRHWPSVMNGVVTDFDEPGKVRVQWADGTWSIISEDDLNLLEL